MTEAAIASTVKPIRDDAARPPVQEWQPHIWEGLDFFAWLKLLARNRGRVHLRYLYVAVIITIVSFVHTFLRLVQQAIFGRRIAKTQVMHPPIFIIGHWRTGTTLLHELLILDERHGYPTTYECLEPNHFLLTENLLTRWCGFLMPSRRPMDNMAAGFNRPQEDEFALCMMGVPSPYLSIAFPVNGPVHADYFSLDSLPARALLGWRKSFMKFIKTLTFKDSRRLVLKSPPHSFRIPELKRLFPDALFVHIVRDPYVLFPSTMHMWQTLAEKHGLQTPHMPWLEDFVFDTFVKLYDRLEATRKQIDPKRFYELRYEDLVTDPVGQMQDLYAHFGLEGFEKLTPRLKEYAADMVDYQTNRYQLTSQQRAEISRRWGRIIDRLGYVSKAAPAKSGTPRLTMPVAAE